MTSSTMDLSYLEILRRSELEMVLSEIRAEKPDANTLLEIGAGSGWQAQRLAENGYSVEAIDIGSSTYSDHRIWPIVEYDGQHIPFPDRYFDVVFSSNVLEHIPHLKEYQDEIKRVLKPDGIAVHVVPSGTWRCWTTLAHYPFILKSLGKSLCSQLLCGSGTQDRHAFPNNEAHQIRRSSKLKQLIKLLHPSRHGEKGNLISEHYYFSYRGWRAVFHNAGWTIKKHSYNHLFYTGYMILGSAVSIHFRSRLSEVFGSSCHIFVLERAPSAPPKVSRRSKIMRTDTRRYV